MTTINSEHNLDRFLKSVQNKAYRVALMATKQRSDALDIVQDSMTKLVINYRDKPHEQWGVLFNRVLHTTILDWHRGQQKQRKWFWFPAANNDEDDAMQEAVEEHVDPLQFLEEQQVAGDLQEAIAALPLRQQQALILRVWEGYDTATTASVMKCSEGSVKTHYHRALKFVQRCWENDATANQTIEVNPS